MDSVNKETETEIIRTWGEMMERYTLIDLIGLSTLYEGVAEDWRGQVALEDPEDYNPGIAGKSVKLLDLIGQRASKHKEEIEKKKEIYEKYYLKSDETKVLEFYRTLYDDIETIKYLIYEFILNSDLLFTYSEGEELYNLKKPFKYDTLILTTEASLYEPNDLTIFFDSLKAKVTTDYGNIHKKPPALSSRFLEKKSYIELFNLIYNHLYKIVHLEQALDDTNINIAIDNCMTECINKLVSMKDEGANMVFSISLHFRISSLYHKPDTFPDEERKDELLGTSDGTQLMEIGEGLFNNTIKNLKVKKRTTKKIQHKSKKQKNPRKYKSKQSKQSNQSKSIFIKTLKRKI